MTSGIGSWGSPGKCYAFWQDFQTCVAASRGQINTLKRPPLQMCEVYRDDYKECISRRKEMQRYAQLNEKLKDYDVPQLIAEIEHNLFGNQK